MSDKEYEITFSSDGKTATIREKKETYYSSYSPPPEFDLRPTFRENAGIKMRSMSKGGKIFLILFLNIYGILHRWSSNRGFGYLLSFFQIAAQICFLVLAILTCTQFFSNPNNSQKIMETILDPRNTALLFFSIIHLSFSLVDLLCVLFSGEVRLFGHKFYPDIIE